MNPSTADLLAAIEASQAAEVVVLPNDPNVLMSAEQAAEHASKPVRVVPTRSLQAGLAALVAFDPGARRGRERRRDGGGRCRRRDGRGHGRVARRRSSNGLSVQQGRVARARRRAGRSRAATTFDEVARAVLERLLAEPRGVADTADRRRAAAARTACCRSSSPATPSSRSRCTRAASPTTRCSSRPSDAAACPRRPRRGQRHLPRDARARARAGARADRGRQRRERRRGGRAVRAARARRRARRLPDARHERRRDDARPSCSPRRGRA